MRELRRSLPILIVCLVACAEGEDEPPPGGEPRCGIAGSTGPSCDLDDGEAPLLDQALSRAGLTRASFGFSDADWAEGYVPVLDDPFRLPWFTDLRGHPARAGCFEGETVWPLDSALAGDHPVSDAILHAAALLDRAEPDAAPDTGQDASDVEMEIAALCAGPAGPCEARVGELPPELGRALAPVIRAIAEGVAARRAMDEVQIDPSYWAFEGGFLLFGFNFDEGLLGRPDVLEYMIGNERTRLNAAAARIAWAVESARWSRFVGLGGVRFDLLTGAGAIQVRDAGAETYVDDVDVLLRVELGGNDTYVDAAGANRSGENPVSVVIDLAGNDTYAYDTVRSPHDRAGLLPSDRAGRFQGYADEQCAADINLCAGPVSLSVASRQGAARNGIAMLFDLAGDDTYRSLRASQGYAQYGVGVLFDGSGNDLYLAEAQSQGAAQFGIGLSIDLGCGNDERRSITESQGFGYVGGAGFLLDDGGDDVYFCDHGDPARGGVRVYGSPQTRVTGNSSFCQGAGFGRRAASAEGYMSGGLGLLRDVSGNDRYDASVFAQGTGYWQGTGILSDGGGSDRYQADWYVQGAAAHYAVGMLLDDGPGDDVFDEDKLPNNMSLGSGHDYSVGVLINEAGNDTYHVTTLAVGSSNCNGVGLFVDNGGDDRYLATSDYNEGMGNVSGECIDTRPTARSMGIMIDAGGRDTYEGPASEFPRPANDTTWNHVRSGHPGERGGGVDGTGETGIHAGSTR